ncbi:MAG TPA: hypothetical protein VJP77_05825 [Planctomycetota bacterium]|nr:hypothetical protein [Planctomycetota bacterium]
MDAAELALAQVSGPEFHRLHVAASEARSLLGKAEEWWRSKDGGFSRTREAGLVRPDGGKPSVMIFPERVLVIPFPEEGERG